MARLVGHKPQEARQGAPLVLDRAGHLGCISEGFERGAKSRVVALRRVDLHEQVMCLDLFAVAREDFVREFGERGLLPGGERRLGCPSKQSRRFDSQAEAQLESNHVKE
jgi:hypothetical protein